MYRTSIKLIALWVGLLLPVGAFAVPEDWKALTLYEKAPVKKQLINRLTDYVKFDTAAKFSSSVPSTPGQLKFAKALAKELKKNGAARVRVDKSAVVTAEIPANSDKPIPVIALLARLDTVPGISGQEVRPQVHNGYKGGDIVISADKKLSLTTQNSPQLLRAHGHDIITASGDTLLGADAKAGAAVLLTAVQYFYDHPQLPHGTIKLVFVPDGTTGIGANQLDITSLGADYAYTLDAADMGQLVDETFSAKHFTAVFEGSRTEDIGYAMNTSFADNILMASDFHTLLPRHKRPETTADKRGFIWVDGITTQGNRSEVTGLIRAFSDEEMHTLTQEVSQAFNTVKAMNYKGKNFSLTFADEGKNMQAALPEVSLRAAQTAMEAEEISPNRTALRTLTMGARLAERGLPAPGLFTGYYHAGTVLEYADVDVMEAAFRTVMRLTTSGM